MRRNRTSPTLYLNLAQVEERLGLAPKSLSKVKLPEPDAIVGPLDNGELRRGTVRGWLPETIDTWAANRAGQGRRTDLQPPKRVPTSPRLALLANELTLRGFALDDITDGRFGARFTILEHPGGHPCGVELTDLGPDPRQRRLSDIRWSAGGQSYFDDNPTVTTPSELARLVAESVRAERI